MFRQVADRCVVVRRIKDKQPAQRGVVNYCQRLSFVTYFDCNYAMVELARRHPRLAHKRWVTSEDQDGI
jgi:hypothetical protein